MTASNAHRNQTNGVLPIAAAQTSGNNSKPPPKPPAAKLKVVVRRLPPGLTADEFVLILGDEWKIGQGKVDWIVYKTGKDSKDPSKPSRPSRAYLHLTSEPLLTTLFELVRQSKFEDSANTFNNSALISPPFVEFASYGRIPGGRRRTDARAGTIDQDVEFMAFLEELANPITKEPESTAEPSVNKSEKVTTTPLVQYLKEKKANKGKEASAKAAAKKQEAQTKARAAKEAAGNSEKKNKDGKATEKGPKEGVKILNREIKKDTTAQQPSTAATAPSSTKLESKDLLGPQRGRVIAAHIRMLQRDLGFSHAQAHRQARRDAADVQKNAEKVAEKKVPDAEKVVPPTQPAKPTTPTAPKAASTQQSRRARAKANAVVEAETKAASASASTAQAPAPTTPVILLKKPETVAPNTAPNTSKSSNKKNPSSNSHQASTATEPAVTSTQGFIKHANPSQGVTVALLKVALEKFGPVTSVEMDKRKGFAYVDFSEPGDLRKAMAANPVLVGNATCQVLLRKGVASDKKGNANAPPTPAVGGSSAGGGGSGAGGSGAGGSTSGSASNRGGRGGSSGGRGRGRGRGGRGGGGNVSGTATSGGNTSESSKTTSSAATTAPAAAPAAATK